MCGKINNNITVDFHIHSYASAHKEVEEVVKNSTVNNLDILFQKLEENNINLFSITDHNIFDNNIFLECKKKIKSKVYSQIKNIIPGIEFDIKFEEEKSKYGHIIALFNFKNDEIDSSHLAHVVKNKFSKQKVYSKKEFEELLKEINLDVILISSQTNALDNSNSSRSLNTHCSNPKDYINCGYISAFEFQKPHIEGILINSLNEINIDAFAKIISSDCHDWEAYPWHDKNSEEYKNHEKKQFSQIRCLPTFKGLMMVFTSPETRFNRRDYKNPVINNIEIGNIHLPLVQGINVIIGDNGSGKTAILESIIREHNKLVPYYKVFKEKYNIKSHFNREIKYKYIPQTHIIQLRNKGILLKDLITLGVGAIEVNNTKFITESTNYFNKLTFYIKNQISINNLLLKMHNNNLELLTDELTKLFFITISNINYLNSTENFHKNRKIDLKNIFESLESELKENDDYYKNNKLYNAFKKVIIDLENLLKIIEKKSNDLEKEISIKNIILSKINDYNQRIKKQSTSDDKKQQDYIKNFNLIKNNIIDLVKLKINSTVFPTFPNPIKGCEIENKQGYKFIKRTKYDDKDFKDDFYETLFNKGWNEEKIRTLNTEDKYKEAIKGLNSNALNYEEKVNENFQKFLEKMQKTEDSILIASSDKNIGSTPGELSLAYYKFIIQNSEDTWELLLLDQPEENISNKKIYSNLIEYLKTLRDEKQIIIVTHNPLLVVNLDADNVIHLKREKGKLNISNGCLEYESLEYNILELISDDMDGGYEAIERRIKVYDKKNN